MKNTHHNHFISGLERRSRFLAELQRKSRLAPSFHSTVKGYGASESHLAQRGGRQRRDATKLAVNKNPLGRVGQFLIDAQFQLAARQ